MERHYEILRPISGVPAKVGDVVDGTQWGNARLLERQLFVRSVPAPQVADTDKQKRR